VCATKKGRWIHPPVPEKEVEMFRKFYFILFVLMATMLFTACGPETPTPKAEPNIPNPASVFCEENGGKLEIRTDASGGQAGFCIFPDGSECDEWAYFRDECKPGDSLSTP